ncbi:MAG: hypothetical protein IKN64_12575 [Desulfovibrio sp.]|nr:hypothetical protein [Desulfovibrio sp.]
MGSSSYPDASNIMITADGGGSRKRLWKKYLQDFANETRLSIDVTHFSHRG